MADYPEVTPERARKWVDWADSRPREDVDAWLAKRPHYSESQIRGMAEAGVEKKYTRDDRTKQVLGMLTEARMKDMGLQASIGPLEAVMDIAGAPGAMQEMVKSGGEYVGNKLGIPKVDMGPVGDTIAKYSPFNFPTKQDFERNLTPKGKLPEPQSEAGRLARKTTRIGTEAATLPLSATARGLTGLAAWLGGEAGRAVDPAYEGLGELTGGVGAAGSTVAKHALPSFNVKNKAVKNIRNQLTDREILEQLNKDSTAPPYEQSSRTRNYMAHAISKSSNPDEISEVLVNRDPQSGLLDDISRQATGMNRSDLKSARQAAYKPIDEGERFSVKDAAKKQALNQFFKNNPRIASRVESLSKDGPVGSMDSVLRLTTQYGGRGKDLVIDRSQWDTLLSDISEDVINLKKQGKHKRAKRLGDQLNNLVTTLDDDVINKARGLAAKEGSIADLEKQLVPILRDKTVPEATITEVLKSTTGLSDPDILDSLYRNIRKAQDEMQMVGKTTQGAKIVSDITAEDKQAAESFASLIAGLVKRAYYLAGGSILKRKSRAKELEVHDHIVSALNDPDDEIWDLLRKDTQRSPSRSMGIMGAGGVSQANEDFN